jgi:hypothetical protein
MATWLQIGLWSGAGLGPAAKGPVADTPTTKAEVRF